MKIKDIIKNKKTFSLEFFPPKHETGLNELVATIKKLSVFKPDFVSVTDSGYGIAKGKNIALSQVLKETTGIEILAHMTCINNTSSEIRNSIYELKKRGIENILALRGDKGNYRDFKSEFNYAVELINEVKKNGDFCIGVAGHPEKHPESLTFESDLLNLKHKIEAGGEFIITQLFFDNDVFFKYREKVLENHINAYIIPGIMPIHSLKSFSEIIKKAGNLSIPPELKKMLNKEYSSKEDFIKYSVEYSTNQCIDLLKNGACGIHFFTFNKSEIMQNILSEIKKYV